MINQVRDCDNFVFQTILFKYYKLALKDINYFYIDIL